MNTCISVRAYAGMGAHVNTVHTCKQDPGKSITLLSHTDGRGSFGERTGCEEALDTDRGRRKRQS